MSRAKLAGLIDILDARSDSYLSWAKSNDVDLYRAAQQAGRLQGQSTKKKRPKAFEMDLASEIAAANFFLLQQLIHVTSRSRKKFRGKEWPHPESAAEVVRREQAEQGYIDLLAEIEFVPHDQFEQHIIEHREHQSQIVRRQHE